MKKTTAMGGDIMATAPTAEAEEAAVHAPARGVHVHAHVRAADGPDAAKRIFTTGNCIKNKKRQTGAHRSIKTMPFLSARSFYSVSKPIIAKIR